MEKFNMVYLTSLPSRSDIKVGSILIDEERRKNKPLDELVNGNWYAFGLFLAICPAQELDGLFSYFYKKYTEKINGSINMPVEKRIQKLKFTGVKEILNIIYLAKTYEGVSLIVSEVDGKISISDIMDILKQSKSSLFLAVCFNGEVNGLIDYFRRKYQSHNIKRIIRHETKGGKNKLQEEAKRTLH